MLIYMYRITKYVVTRRISRSQNVQKSVGGRECLVPRLGAFSAHRPLSWTKGEGRRREKKGEDEGTGEERRDEKRVREGNGERRDGKGRVWPPSAPRSVSVPKDEGNATK